MFRYISLVWNDTDPASAAVAYMLRTRLEAAPRDWKVAIDVPGLFVLHADTRAPAWNIYALKSSSGVVLGTLFRAGDHASIVDAALTTSDTSAIVTSAGRHLIQRFWGRYVAFLRERGGSRTFIVRDPHGGVPCLISKVDRVHVVYSDVEDFCALDVLRLTVNMRFISTFVCYPAAGGPETGLNEVGQLIAGECLEVRGDGSAVRSLYWNAAALARSGAIEDEQQAVAAIRQTTLSCVAAWASLYPAIIHNLSGGLDSSVVASCLRAAPSQPSVTCLTYFCSTEAEDERAYARLAASTAGYELIERQESMHVRLEEVLTIRRAPRPGCYEEAARHARFEEALAVSKGATGAFSGIGGDHIFFQNPLLLTPADYLHGRLMRRGFFHLALSVSRAERTSLCAVLRTALRSGTLRHPWNPLDDAARYELLVTPEAVQAAMSRPEYVHPALRDAQDLPPGKLSHIRMITTLVPYGYHPFVLSNFPDAVFPLISQPLIELALRIPTYVLSARGVDRSAERKAFEGLVPQAILRRRVKGGIDAYLLGVLQKNLPFVRGLLLDGRLVREGLLDRTKLERVLSTSEPWWGPEGLEVLCDHLSTEVWLRSWS